MMCQFNSRDKKCHTGSGRYALPSCQRGKEIPRDSTGNGKFLQNCPRVHRGVGKTKTHFLYMLRNKAVPKRNERYFPDFARQS